MLLKTIESKPEIVFNLQNWKYETNKRSEMTEDKDGRMTYRTETDTVRKNGSFHTEKFLFKAWVDLSPPNHALDYI